MFNVPGNENVSNVLENKRTQRTSKNHEFAPICAALTCGSCFSCFFVSKRSKGPTLRYL